MKTLLRTGEKLAFSKIEIILNLTKFVCSNKQILTSPPPYTILVSFTVAARTHSASCSERSASSMICWVAPRMTIVHASPSGTPENRSKVSSPIIIWRESKRVLSIIYYEKISNTKSKFWGPKKLLFATDARGGKIQTISSVGPFLDVFWTLWKARKRELTSSSLRTPITPNISEISEKSVFSKADNTPMSCIISWHTEHMPSVPSTRPTPTSRNQFCICSEM